MNNVFFTKAKPIWIANKNKNTHIKLFASVNAEEAEYIRIATSGLYQLFINGEFVAAGPVRSGRGYFRIDCIDISDRISLAVNKIEVLCVHYGIPCYGLMLQEPFVTCEITKNDMIICSTGGNGFDVCLCKDYIDKVSRYSCQRGFAESYLVGEAKNEYVNPVVCNDRKYIERVAPYPFYERKEIEFSTIGICTYEKQTEHKKEWWNDEDTEKYAIDKVFEELQDINYFKGEKVILNKALLSDKEYVIGSVHHNITGVLSFECNCRRETVLYVTYDEIMQDSFVNPQRNSCNACVKYRIKPGEHKVVNFEPGTMKYICFTVISGEIEISKAYVIEYKHKPETNVVEIDDFELKKIYDAAVETFRQNAFDIYTDCPSRERAGWLCDSFFMGRAEHLLYGESLVEKAFLENYLMEDIFKNLPEGMFPMCYPADHPTGYYIPNWAMWLMIELEEYYNRTGDFELVSRYKVKAYKLLDFFKKYENIDGLLEKLDEWVFVDWSKSGDYVQDVNFPTNMLYAYMLEKISVLFYDESLKIKAENVKEKIRKLSYKTMALNEVILIGRLTRDVETQTINDALNARFTLAVDRNYKAKGEDKPQADFIPVTVWRRSAEFAEKYFSKGKQVYVVGSLETYTFDKDGEKRFAFRVNASRIGFADTARAGQETKAGTQPANGGETGNAAPAGFEELSFMEEGEFSDDLPF